jgi:hypothetical protein
MMHGRTDRRRPFMSTGALACGLAGLGSLLLLTSIAARLAAARPLPPGRLVVRYPDLTWRHPSPREESARLPKIDEAGASFEIENVGERPIRIIGVESSCGCSTTKVTPDFLPPGQQGIVEVRATPFAVGERLLTVNLRTDSPLTPVVGLRLRILGWRSPPFLLQSGGDLIPAVLGHHQVGGLEIPVDHAALVGIVEGITDLDREVDHLAPGHRAALLQDLLQGGVVPVLVRK